MCGRDGISVFPQSRKISPNSLIVIEGYAESQVIINELGLNYPIYLKHGGKKIKLLVKEIVQGQFNLNQALLIPETNLEPKKKYTLIIENLPKGEQLERWNDELGKNEAIVYVVENLNDSIPPIFKTIPKEIKKTYIDYACGPEIKVLFEFKIIEENEFLVKARMKDLSTGKEVIYYLKPKNEILEIGHGMCSGAFLYGENYNYEIEFSLIDFSGNKTNWTEDRITFTRPTEFDSVRKP
jgi:hypothetical protein